MRLIRVLKGNPLATVQDAGRPGFQSLGVPAGGPMDPAAFRTAARVVGNGPSDAGIEWAGGGLVLQAEDEPDVATSDAGPLRWASGRLALPPPRRVWAYLAVAGGILTEPLLGSRSASPRAGLGRPLRDGDLLSVGEGPGKPGAQASPPHAEGMRLLWTSRPFPEAARRALLDGTFSPSRDSDRMGYRLEGPALPGPFPPARTLPTVAGAVQVTPEGQVIVLMADRQTTGGYPVIAVVHADDLGELAQKRAGEPFRFREGSP